MNTHPAAILLCAGEGTRMNDNRTHKVCYEIAGVPTVIRQINNLREAGITRFVVVVGSKADAVMRCLDGVDGVVYAFQPVQNGTGAAAVYGLKALSSTGYVGDAFIIMGDKIISPDILKEIIERKNSVASDVVFAVQPKEFNTSGGRIVEAGGKVCGIVEMMDSMMLCLGESDTATEEAYSEILKDKDISDKKKTKLIANALEKNGNISSKMRLCGHDFDSDAIENSQYVNAGTYLVNVSVALDALSHSDSSNAQKELYLTDIINNTAPHDKNQIVVVSDAKKILTYSTMDELLKLHKYFETSDTGRGLYTASQWLSKFEAFDDKMVKLFESIYGEHKPYFIEERRQAYIKLLTKFIKKYGDKEVVITRSPGRVNLLGRHIEHKGGSINVMSIDRETLLVAAPRDDDIINLANVNKNFKEYSFSLLETIKQCDKTDWLDFIESDNILQMVVDNKGEWVNYVKAGLLRLQLNDRGRLLSGMDMMFSGNIPMAAGLSSSSSIVVATSEAVVALNNLDLKVKDFIHLCGEGEWFVGSRGGAGDHAAMKCGKMNKITHIEFCPFEIKESVDFPQEYQIVVANSFVEAKKSAGAKDQFNQKVACYDFGLMLVKKLFPKLSTKIKYLKDINPNTLDIPQSEIYKILLKLPLKITSDELYEMLPENVEQIKRTQKNHSIPEYYEIRSTMLYGISECLRAEKCIEALKDEDYKSLGRLMNISHNGDRVSVDGEVYDNQPSDDYLNNLITDLLSQDEKRVSAAQIYNQPGGYGCSIKQIDELVDFATKQDGVIGAELSGAGLGGCIIILVKKDCSEKLLRELKSFYYDKNSLPMGAQVFIPVSGSMTLDI